MSINKESILAAIADLLIFLSGAKSYWYTLNTSHEHGFHMTNRFGMTHENYVALLVAADLARYVNGVLTIKIKQWESFLRGYRFSGSLVEHAIGVEKKKMSLDGNSRQAFYVIRFGIIGKDSPLRLEDQDLGYRFLTSQTYALGLTRFQFNRSTEAMVLPMLSELFHAIKDKHKDDECKKSGDIARIW